MKEKLKQFITTLWIYVNIANTKTFTTAQETH
ncbi:hypothetical protein CDSM653_02380 [Caldanaerobacter subterraneus subsp. pacificus DSM 12653]|uniref:Uncharacterized protein n=1 Tax=Caldanaerobacter subterraneus subsp. pacificus DSM 12653 TaxID=391606 RepID=A0A0F5PIX8_9THEO|nr:hypothetical protein CDSM653_02380 [Caldanaerobacter subterraneus subsp. pacificus DSM 12653]